MYMNFFKLKKKRKSHFQVLIFSLYLAIFYIQIISVFCTTKNSLWEQYQCNFRDYVVFTSVSALKSKKTPWRWSDRSRFLQSKNFSFFLLQLLALDLPITGIKVAFYRKRVEIDMVVFNSRKSKNPPLKTKLRGFLHCQNFPKISHC